MSIWSSQSPLATTAQTASNILPGLDGALPTRPERQRGIWNFLTWSFFLANFLTATEVAGGAAHAAQSADGNTPDGSHAGDATAQASMAPHPAIDPPSLENAPTSVPVPESEGRLATNLISPNAIPVMQSADVSASNADVPHTAPFTSGGSFDYLGSAGSQTDQTGGAGHAGGEGDGVTTVVDHVVTTVVQTVGDVVSAATNALGDAVGEVGHVATSVVSALGDTVDTTLHAVTGALSSPADLITNLPSSIGTIAGSLDHVLTTTVTEVAQAPLNVLHAAVSDLGIAAPGSLNFSDSTPEHSLIDAPNGYSQYNLAVQDVASADNHVVTSDTGSITNIITSALGIGHIGTDQTSSDHSSDHQPLQLIADDLQGTTHHNLLG